MWLMHLDKKAEDHQIFWVDPEYQLLSLVSSVPVVEEVKSCACLTTAPFKLSAKVFDDKHCPSIDIGAINNDNDEEDKEDKEIEERIGAIRCLEIKLFGTLGGGWLIK